MGAIYKITNQITGHIYVGSAMNLDKRKWVHVHHLRNNKHHSPILQNSWNKYGECAFVFSVIEDVPNLTTLIQREQFWMDTLKPKFNCCPKAGSPMGVKHTLEARMNMSLAKKGVSLRKRGHKKDCSCCICFRPIRENSPRYIQREERLCSCGCKRRFTCMITSDKRFISGHNKSQLGRKQSIEQILHHTQKISKPMSQYSLAGELIKEWANAKIAGSVLKISASNIGRCCLRKRGTCGGFIWKFK